MTGDLLQILAVFGWGAAIGWSCRKPLPPPAVTDIVAAALGREMRSALAAFSRNKAWVGADNPEAAILVQHDLKISPPGEPVIYCRLSSEAMP